MAAQVLGDEGTGWNNGQLALPGQAKHACDEFRADAFASKRIGDFGVNQAKRILRFAVQDECGLAVDLQFETMKGRVVGNLRLRHIP